MSSYREPDAMDARDDLHTLPDLLAPVLDRLLWVFAAALVAGIAFFALSFAIQPRYEVSITIAPTNHDTSALADGRSALGQVGGLLGLGNLAQSDFVRDALGVLRSRRLVGQFVEQNNLVPILFESRDPEDPEPTLAEATNYFQDNVLGIAEDKVSGLIDVSMQWREAEVATRWANDFVQLANTMIRDRTRQNARSGNEFLGKELENTSTLELRQAIYRLMENNIKMEMLANTREEFAFSVLDPAVLPADDDFAWPNRPLLAILGFVFGGAMAAAIAIWAQRKRPGQPG